MNSLRKNPLYLLGALAGVLVVLAAGAWVFSLNSSPGLSVAPPARLNTCTALSFSPAPGSPFKMGNGPRPVAVGDFNGDGKNDFAVAAATSGPNVDATSGNSKIEGSTLNVWLGDGAGNFKDAPGSPYIVGTQPRYLAAADFNGDGVTDLAVSSYNGPLLLVLLGDKSGPMHRADGVPQVSNYTASLTAGDFNRDGKMDLAATSPYAQQNATVFLGDGKGGLSMAPGSPFDFGNPSSPINTGDLNGDGILDLVTADFSNKIAKSWIGGGQGSFTAAQGGLLSTGAGPQSIEVGDVNTDGKLDLFTADSESNTISLAYGNGKGSFDAVKGNPLPTGGIQPRSVTAADFNGDGILDLVASNWGSNNVTILQGDGKGGFAPATGSPVGAGANPWGIATIDFNGDKKPDIVVANSGDNTVSVLLDTCR